MKKAILFLLFIASFTLAKSQMLSPEVIASGGDFFVSPAGSLSWTLGEPVVETISNSAIQLILTQGFQQPVEIDTTVGIGDIGLSNVFVNLYPNPASDYIYLDFYFLVS